MPAVKDPYVSVIFEWETGVKQDKKVHTVKLEIPPGQINMRMSKNVQKTVTTKGWVLNHGIDNLAIVSASGQAYQPRIREHALEEGFNPEIALSGLEFLQAAYVASGRLSSNPSLTTTINTDLYRQTLINPEPPAFERLIETVSNRTQILDSIRQKVSSVGIINVSTNEVSFPENETNNVTLEDVDQIRATLSADVYSLDISDAEKSQAWNLLNVLRNDNSDLIFLQFGELAVEQPSFQQLVDKFEVLLSRSKNQNLGLNIPIPKASVNRNNAKPNTIEEKLDPSIFTYIKRDPFSVLKALAAIQIFNKLRSIRSNTVLKGLLNVQESQADDWVVTVYMYWQDMILLGHFEAFDMLQQANIIGLWNWSFTFVVHEGWLLKNNNIVPFTRAFDPNITNIEAPGSAVTEQRNINRPLERLLFKL